MRFKAKCVEPGQMIALSRVASAIHKLTKVIVLVLRKDRMSFIMPTSVATFSNASATSRCLSSLLCEIDTDQMFADYAIDYNSPDDDGVYMHLDTDSLARAFTLKSSTDRSLSFLIKLSKVGDKPCLVVRREQISTSMADAGADMPDPNLTGSGISSFYIDHKLGLEWVARRHWASYRDVPNFFSDQIPRCGLGLPNDLRHMKIVIDRLSNLSRDGKTVAKIRIDSRRHTLGLRLNNLTFDAETEFSDLPVFNCSDYNHVSQQQFILGGASNQTSKGTEFEALVDLRRLGEALGALEKITQQSFVPATIAVLGLKNRRAVALVAVIDVGVQVLAAISTISSADDEDDAVSGSSELSSDENVGRGTRKPSKLQARIIQARQNSDEIGENDTQE